MSRHAVGSERFHEIEWLSKVGEDFGVIVRRYGSSVGFRPHATARLTGPAKAWTAVDCLLPHTSNTMGRYHFTGMRSF
jgi:hypothetical protein